MRILKKDCSVQACWEVFTIGNHHVLIGDFYKCMESKFGNININLKGNLYELRECYAHSM